MIKVRFEGGDVDFHLAAWLGGEEDVAAKGVRDGHGDALHRPLCCGQLGVPAGVEPSPSQGI